MAMLGIMGGKAKAVSAATATSGSQLSDAQNLATRESVYDVQGRMRTMEDTTRGFFPQDEEEQIIRRDRAAPGTGRGIGGGGSATDWLMAAGGAVTPLAGGYRQARRRASSSIVLGRFGGVTGGGEAGSIGSGFPTAVA